MRNNVYIEERKKREFVLTTTTTRIRARERKRETGSACTGCCIACCAPLTCSVSAAAVRLQKCAVATAAGPD